MFSRVLAIIRSVFVFSDFISSLLLRHKSWKLVKMDPLLQLVRTSLNYNDFFVVAVKNFPLLLHS